ncbi:conserved hypothetical protein [Ricinus communis]|uniref:TF-B3 domain-containing protein n=1 Tax=Ricinus communis TaxID=3988 RepID=B9S8P8_RICCO|nr:conserved hypothetical protein [Ricinus communis]
MIETSDANSAYSTQRGKSPLPCSQPRKKMRSDETGNTVATSNSETLSSKRKVNLNSYSPEFKVRRVAAPSANSSFSDRSLPLINPIYLANGYLNLNQVIGRINVAMPRSNLSKCKDKQLSHERKAAGGQPSEGPPCLRIVSAAESANNFVSKHPFFRVVMRSTYLNDYVIVFRYIDSSKAKLEQKQGSSGTAHLQSSMMGSTSYAYCNSGHHYASTNKLCKKHMQHQNKNITLQFEGRTWSATFCSLTNRIRGGWKSFVRNNSLREGDVCVFELIDSRKALVKVSIFRSEN